MNTEKPSTAPVESVVRTRDQIACDPQYGDWIENRSAREHKRRYVYDRYGAGKGDVEYVWDMRCDYHGRCTLEDWAAFCGSGSVNLSSA